MKSTKRKLCDSFIELYTKKNIENITVKDITSNANLNRGTFYLYYQDINEMLFEIENELIEGIKEKAQIIISQYSNISINLFIKTLPKFFKENEKYLRPLLEKDLHFIAGIKKVLKPLIYNNLKRNVSNKEVDYLVEYHFSAVLGLINLWIINKKDIPLDQLINIVYEISTNGVVTLLQNKMLDTNKSS